MASSADDSNSKLTPIQLIDQICDQFENELQSDSDTKVEDFLDRVEEQHQNELLEQLLLIEMEVLGSPSRFEDFASRFPGRSRIVAKVIRKNHSDSNSKDAKHDASQVQIQPTALPTERIIGPYEVISVLGKGGMGTVFEARQEKPIKRRVALKLINVGMDSELVVSRFEGERQALALMNHPNIARVIDGGTASTGRPYFVMELVDGIPLDQYCDQKRLTTRQRLELFQLICDAVQHAHQQGIIHRDLKPSNILVSESNGKPIPKIIDFGLAKALDADLTDRTIQTQFNQAIGTLQYMCPEQTELGSQQIDTRADIYSLGIVLYQLLTGSPPLDSDTIKSMSMDRIFATIRDKDFVRPSRHLQNSTEMADSISEVRNTNSASLISELSGDLDWIVMKAIEKDRDRRYGSASEFSADIKRFLNHEVVLASPPSMTYSVRKFVKRNRGLVTAASLITSLLLISSVVSTSLYLNAETARKEAFDDRQAAVDALGKAEEETIAKQEAIDKLDDAVTVGMARLGDFAMESGKPDEAVVWYSAAARDSLDQPERRDANLIRLASAIDSVTIPTAAIFSGITSPEALEPDTTNRFVIVRNYSSRMAEVWDVESETRMVVAQSADWIEGGKRLVLIDEDEVRLLGFPSLKVLKSKSVSGASDVTASVDSQLISICTADGVKIYGLSGDKILERHYFNVSATRSDFHPQGNLVIAWSIDQTSLFQLKADDGPAGIKWSRKTINDEPTGLWSLSMAWNTLNRVLRPRFIGNSSDVVLIAPDERKLEIRDVNGVAVHKHPLGRSPAGFTLNSHGNRIAVVSRREVDLCELSVEQKVDGEKSVKLKSLGRRKLHRTFLNDMSFRDDGSLLTSSYDAMARISYFETNSDPFGISESPSEISILHQFALSVVATTTNDNVLFTGQEDGLVRRWVLGRATKRLKQIGTTPWSGASAMTKSPNGKFFTMNKPTWGSDRVREVQVFNQDGSPASGKWNVGGMHRFSEFDATSEKLWVAASTGTLEDSEWLTQPGSVKLWDWKSGDVREVLHFDKTPVAVRPFGKFLVVMLNNEMVWFDLDSETIKQRVPIGSPFNIVAARYFAVSPDGKTIACFGTNDGMHIFDHDGNLQHHFGKGFNLNSAAFSNDGKRIAATRTHQHCAYVWDVESGDRLQVIAHPDAMYSICFSPDDKWLLTASRDGQARVLDWNSGKLIGVANHEDEVYVAKFFEGNDLIITGCKDETSRIWDWRTGAQLGEMLGDDIFDIDVGDGFIRIFGWMDDALTFRSPRRADPESIDFFQWCTGRQWHSVDQPPVVLGSKQWMDLWQQRPKNYVKQEARRRLGLQPHFDLDSESRKIAKHQYLHVKDFLWDLNQTYDPSAIVPGFENGKVVSLKIKWKQISDLTPISKLKDLKSLDLQGSTFDGGVADIGFLRDLPNLESFYCSSRIKDLSPLSKLPLKVVFVRGCGHSDLSPLKGMPLDWLCINSTKVADLSPLKGMPLKTLMLANTSVSDLSPLDGMQIEFLAINDGTRIRDLDQIRQFPLRELRIDNPETHRELIDSFPNLERLNQKPIAEFNQD